MLPRKRRGRRQIFFFFFSFLSSPSFPGCVRHSEEVFSFGIRESEACTCTHTHTHTHVQESLCVFLKRKKCQFCNCRARGRGGGRDARLPFLLLFILSYFFEKNGKREAVCVEIHLSKKGSGFSRRRKEVFSPIFCRMRHKDFSL